ncbi:hypothetical protein SEA_CHUCKLY_65 [Mycobacterium phage Chuckly]|uniref:Uncharacterized protein n=1 Tax=Mycobacterium phage Chuckly TaxID=2656569 RepID=A0A649VE00_9CAUD|nr:hypothetical protein I5H22_gp065 [Mycobacterium phage Chuckly]QGJ90305.1 hypothetical protein SEA_CHUCKLY_65 [Mycobacterium phage Chuckly]
MINTRKSPRTFDTRIIEVGDNVKAGAAALDCKTPSPAAAQAAFDDGRCLLDELLTETTWIPDRPAVQKMYRSLEEAVRLMNLAPNNRRVQGAVIEIADRVLGASIRLADRWTA